MPADYTFTQGIPYAFQGKIGTKVKDKKDSLPFAALKRRYRPLQRAEQEKAPVTSGGPAFYTKLQHNMPMHQLGKADVNLPPCPSQAVEYNKKHPTL